MGAHALLYSPFWLMQDAFPPSTFLQLFWMVNIAKGRIFSTAIRISASARERIIRWSTRAHLSLMAQAGGKGLLTYRYELHANGGKVMISGCHF